MKLRLVLVTTMLLLGRRCQAVTSVQVDNQTVAVVVRAGRRVVMSCTSSTAWFFCLWDTPGRRDLECAIQHGQTERICSENNTTKLTGEREACNVEFEVEHDQNLTHHITCNMQTANTIIIIKSSL